MTTKKTFSHKGIPIRNRFAIFNKIIIAIFMLIGIMVAIACVVSIDDVVVGQGTVSGIREWELKTIVDSHISKVFVNPGDEVKKGNPLIAFEDRDQRNRITTLTDQLKELELQKEVKKKSFELLKIDPLPEYYRNTSVQLEEARERLAKSENELKVYSDLYRSHAITRQEYLNYELDNLGYKMLVKRLSNDQKRIDDGMERETIEKAGEELRLLDQTIANKKDDIAMEKKKLGDYVLYAPDDGVVTEILSGPGNYHEKGETVIKFSANRNKKVIAMVEESQIFKVMKGQTANIYSNQYNYLDYGFFQGRVSTIFELPVMQGKMKYYPVIITLNDERYPLRFGAGCDVKIITGRDKLICVLLGIHGEDFWKRRGLIRDKK